MCGEPLHGMCGWRMHAPFKSNDKGTQVRMSHRPAGKAVPEVSQILYPPSTRNPALNNHVIEPLLRCHLHVQLPPPCSHQKPVAHVHVNTTCMTSRQPESDRNDLFDAGLRFGSPVERREKCGGCASHWTVQTGPFCLKKRSHRRLEIRAT